MSTYKPVHQAALPSVALRAIGTYLSQEFDNSGGHRGALVIIDFTTRTGAATLTVTLQGYDYTSGKWYTLIASTALAAVATTQLLSYPGATVVANSVGQWGVPSKFRVQAVVAADTATFSIGLELVP
jgi:hypothetical protein